MKLKRIRANSFTTRALVILILAALLPACSLGGLASQSPTADLQKTNAVAQTQVALTVAAELTRLAPQGGQNSPTATLVVNTATQAPTATATVTLTPIPSFTPITPSPTNTIAPPTATFVPTWTATTFSGCSITEQGVAFGDDFPKNADFDGKWVVKNTSTETWYASEVDIKYISGQKFQVNVDALDLQSDVPVNGTYTVVVDMRAPGTAGRYSATWAFVSGSKTLCILPITIDVKN